MANPDFLFIPAHTTQLQTQWHGSYPYPCCARNLFKSPSRKSKLHSRVHHQSSTSDTLNVRNRDHGVPKQNSPTPCTSDRITFVSQAKK